MSPEQAPHDEPFGIDEPIAPRGPLANDTERLLASLAYVSQIIVPAVFPIVLLVSADTSKSRYLRYHAVQSLAVLVASIVYYLAATVVYALLSAILSCLGCALWVIFLVPTAAMGYCGYAAFRGDYVEIPWLTRFLRENAWL